MLIAQISESGVGLSLQATAGTHDYQNPSVIRRNALPPRAYSIPSTSLSLNGLWSFHYASSPETAPSPSSEPASSEWGTLAVPGHWQLQGHGIPHYTNVSYPFPVLPPFVPAENSTGTYKRAFSIPSSWPKDSRIRLRFEGVDSAYHLFVNGVLTGFAKESRNASEFDVTDLVSRTEVNQVWVRVYQWSDGSYLEDQDQWWLSGIFRDVWLIEAPASRIDDFKISSRFDTGFVDADLVIEVDTVGAGKLEIELLDVISSTVIIHESKDLTADSSHTVQSLPVQTPRKWTAETPHLYDLKLTFGSHVVSLRHGFRHVSLTNGLITVNGTPIRLRGVNRHDHHPLHGRAVPQDFLRKDLVLMKTHNVNALRTSHYPPTPHLLDLADEIGLYVLEEADLECHGFYDAIARPLHVPEGEDYEERKRRVFPAAAKFTSDNPEWKSAYVSRMEQMVRRDSHHASVIIWSLGNEAFYGQNHAAMYDYVKSVDQDRPVHYEGDPNAVSADMFSYMYPTIEQLTGYIRTKGVSSDGTWTKPVVLCEYAHAMGNGPGWLQEYVDLFETEQRLQGGFIWEWANHGLWKPAGDDGKGGFYAYGGDFGDVPNDGTFVMDGLVNSQHQPTPGLIELKKAYEPLRIKFDGTKLKVKSLYDFETDRLTGLWKLETNGKLKVSGSFEVPVLKPGEEVVIDAQLPHVKEIHHEQVLTAVFVTKQGTPWSEAGHEVAWAQALTPATSALSVTKAQVLGDLEVSESPCQLTVSGAGGLDITISRVNGLLTNWSYNNKTTLLMKSLKVGLWRPSTDNDVPVSLPYWKRYGVDSLATQLRKLSTEKVNGGLKVTTETVLSAPVLAWTAHVITEYRISNTGTLEISVSLHFTGLAPEHVPRVGLDIQLASALENVSWFGCGPGESYPDKARAQKVGWYSSKVAELETPYDVPQERGNHGGTRWVNVYNSHNTYGFTASRVGEWQVPGQTHGLFYWKAGIYSDEVVENAKHPTDLVAGDPVFRLDAAVAGVGTAACGPGVKKDLLVKANGQRYRFGFKFNPQLDREHVKEMM